MRHTRVVILVAASWRLNLLNSHFPRAERNGGYAV